MTNRVTLDDLLEQRSPGNFGVVQDEHGGRPRVIKKKPRPLPEMYQNETELKKAAADLLTSLWFFLRLKRKIAETNR